MKAINNGNILENSVDFQSTKFGIKSKNLGHIIHLLRDQIYSDKILAVIREYSCNGYDANVMGGRRDVPIQVVLPTVLDPVFKVRDFGAGLSPQEIQDIFVSYGESTKRDTNEAIGFLGIGAKSGFAYGSNFLVTSYNNGTKTVYDCVLDKTNVGECLTMTTESMKPGEKDGIEITVPVKKDDIDLFVNKAVEFFQYWDVRPDILNNKQAVDKVNVERKVLFSGKDGDWSLYAGRTSSSYNRITSIALMGNIPYPINWNTVRFSRPIKNEVWEIIKNNNLIIKFKIGDVQFAPSREALQYTDLTNDSITRICEKVASEIVSVVEKRFSDSKTFMESLNLYHEVFEEYGSPLYNASNMFSIVWKGYRIKASYIEDVNHLDAAKGWNAEKYSPYRAHIHKKIDPTVNVNDPDVWFPVMECYELHTNGTIRRSRGHRYECQRIEPRKAKILVVDTDKHYISKAVAYIFSKNPATAIDDNYVKRVYVFRFLTVKACKDAYEHLALSHLNVIKYSTIASDVKKTIVRTVYNSSGKKSLVVSATKGNSANNEYSARCMKIEEGHCYYSMCHPRQLSRETINMVNGKGYYIQMESVGTATLNKKSMYANDAVYRAHMVVWLANKLLGKKIDKFYCVGARFYNHKKLNSNWVCIDTLVEELEKNLTSNNRIKTIVAVREFIKSDPTKVRNMGRLLSVVVKSNKVTDKSNALYEMTKLFTDNGLSVDDVFSDSNSVEETTNVLEKIEGHVISHVVADDALVKSMTECCESIKAAYPMLRMVFASGAERFGYSVESVDMYSQYINLVDDSKKHKTVKTKV